jgi:hypothetical protein
VAVRRAGIKNILWASSETVLGLPFDIPPPYVPVDEEYTGRPESTYSLVKFLEEQMGRPVLPLGSAAEDDRAALHQRHGAGGLRGNFRRSTPTRDFVSGTSGVTSTRATVLRRFAGRSTTTRGAARSS